MGVLRNLIQYRAFRPGRFAEHVLERLMIRVGYDLLHAFHGLALRLQ
jgi:hypothetical protein